MSSYRLHGDHDHDHDRKNVDGDDDDAEHDGDIRNDDDDNCSEVDEGDDVLDDNNDDADHLKSVPGRFQLSISQPPTGAKTIAPKFPTNLGKSRIEKI